MWLQLQMVMLLHLILVMPVFLNLLDQGHLNFRPLVFCFISADWHHQFTTLYNTGLNYGGPVSMQYGWFMALAFTMLVALSMAEICSSYPTTGGLYYWSAKLAGPRWAPFASWITGCGQGQQV
ncbi:hypothetical protein JHK87_029260 [Glycine soja]|nr:hypothetical protein JHK87_029260 [Glycine soja]